MYDVSNILVSIQSLLNDPNSKSPANADAAKLYEEDRAEYYRRVRQVIEYNLQLKDSDDEQEEPPKPELQQNMIEENTSS